MADYNYTTTFRFIQRESQYGRWVEPWQAECTQCKTRIRVTGKEETAGDFIDRLEMHNCK